MNQGNGLWCDHSPADATRICSDCGRRVYAEDCDGHGRCDLCSVPEICCRCLAEIDHGEGWRDGRGNVLCPSCNLIIHDTPEWFEYGGESGGA